MKSSFGTKETLGYAKVYTSVEKAKAGEKDYILIRNAVIAPPKKAAKEERKPAEKPGEKVEPKEEIVEKPEGEEKGGEERRELQKGVSSDARTLLHPLAFFLHVNKAIPRIRCRASNTGITGN